MLAGLGRKIICFLNLFVGVSLLGLVPKADELIDIQVICDTATVAEKSEVLVGLEISLAPDWHIYWKNAGESGYSTTLKWSFSQEKWRADPLQFPAPYHYEYEGISGYALKNQFVLLNTLFAPSKLEEVSKLEGRFDALICNESTCLPYEFQFSLQFPRSQKQELIKKNISRLKNARRHLPIAAPLELSAKASFNGGDGKLIIHTEKFSQLATDKFYFYPENSSIMTKQNSHSFFDQTKSLEITWQFLDDREKWPDQIDGVLNHPELSNPWKISVPVEQVEPFPSSVPESYSHVEEREDEFILLNILLGFVLIAMAAWAYGRSRQPQALVRNWQVFAWISLCAGCWLGYPANPTSQFNDSLNWEAWSPQLEEELLAEGRAVYIDYTAKWCLSCQVNKRVYSDEQVRNALFEKEVHLLRADWTQKSPDILKSLQSHGREGVPFNIYYPPAEKGNPAQPISLPEILTTHSLVDLISDGNLSVENSPKEDHFLTLVVLAWLGGLILNLMPCVFPVIGLKIMGFVKQAGEDRTQISRHGWIFTLGVVLSFWILVGILLTLRDGLQHQLGWGFQLQDPIFVSVLAALLFLFGLSLSGVFEMGISITGLGSNLSQKAGLSGSFFSGVLATVVATPCMAPFLGVAVGAALTMSALPSFIIFTSIAIGLSTPYLLLSFFPAWLGKLPKPGIWMESFKQLMAFPVYATVAWLIWTLDGLL